MRRLALIACLCLGLSPALAEQVKISDRVYLIPDVKGSTTRFEMIVNAGSSDEAGGNVTGIAHYLEHLLLVGRNAEHAESAMRMFGDASSNGWTNDKATVFLHNLPTRPDGGAADLEKLFGFYSARLKDFSITEADAAREKNVVLQEHDVRVQSNPTSLFYRDVSKALIPDHPAGQWTIGSRDSIKAMTVEQARAFHQNWYAINNVWFVVRGEISPEKLKDISDRALAGLAPRQLPERLKDREPALDRAAQDVVQISGDAVRPLVTVARMVHIDETDTLKSNAAVSLLAAFAGGRFTGSAYDTLVENRRVAADDLSVWIRRVAPSTFAISLASSVAVDHTKEELKAAMTAYIDTLATSGMPDDERLARLRKRLDDQWTRAGKVRLQAHARFVNWLASGNPPGRIDEWPHLLETTTRHDIERFAKGLSAPGRQLAGVLEPKDNVQ